MEDGFLIIVNLLANLGPEQVTITQDSISRSKIKLEWDNPIRDKDQLQNFFYSGFYQAKGIKQEKRLELGDNDMTIQAIRKEAI